MEDKLEQLEKCMNAWEEIAKLGNPNEVTRAQIFGFRQAYQIIHGLDVDGNSSPLAKQELSEGKVEEKDPLFDNAKNCVGSQWTPGDTITARELASRLHVSYARASALIDQLEAAGVISPKEGGKPRKVV